MSDNTVTIVGNATRDPELRFTQSGMAVCSFGVAVNRKWQNRQSQEWEEKVSFVDITCWGTLGENVAESIEKGMRVVVSGRLDMDQWESKEGEKRSKLQLIAEQCSPSLQWASAVVTKNQRSENGPSAREPDFGHGAFGPSGDPSEEPFVVPVDEWWPQVGLGSHPERLLP